MSDNQQREPYCAACGTHHTPLAYGVCKPNTPGERETLRGKAPKPWPAIYTWVWSLIVAAGRRQGYAMAIHGSMTRDLDVIAAPWTDDAGSPEELLAEIRETIQIYLDEEKIHDPHYYSEKPHGRVVQSLHMGGGAYIDLSVMPRALLSAPSEEMRQLAQEVYDNHAKGDPDEALPEHVCQVVDLARAVLGRSERETLRERIAQTVAAHHHRDGWEADVSDTDYAAADSILALLAQPVEPVAQERVADSEPEPQPTELDAYDEGRD